jgi:hypothetical protein
VFAKSLLASVPMKAGSRNRPFGPFFRLGAFSDFGAPGDLRKDPTSGLEIRDFQKFV